MIYYVSGPVTVLEPGLAVIDCGGVGYGCRVTAYTAAQLKLNQTARLYVTESIREDAFDLYGFISKEEQRCYELLTSVNGVGPKAAMSILSFNSRMIRWAIFLPTPWAAVRSFSSPVITARVKFCGPADRIAIAAFGPTPLTVVSSS